MGSVGADPRCRIDAHPQAHVVNFARECHHVGKFFVRLDGIVLSSASALPTVVDVDIAPAMVSEPFFDHCACRGKYLFLRNVACPAVPTVPAHRWSEGDFIAHNDPQVAFATSQRILGVQTNDVFTRPFHPAGNPSGGRVKFQPPREPFS